MLKSASFKDRVGKDFKFAYAVLPYGCRVFTTIPSDSSGSSINYAERIAEEIAQREGAEVLNLRFFDLQTRNAYGGSYALHEEGLYEFEEVIFEAEPWRSCGVVASAWRLAECPHYVATMFRQFIDGEPCQAIHRRFESFLPV